MRERRIALVAVDSQWRDPKGTFYSFSYGVQKLNASLRSAPDLADVETIVLDLRTPDPDEFFETLREFRPSLVALSTYVWSLDVFSALTERLRRFDPSIVIVAGGPAARRSVLDLPPHHGLRDRLDAIVPGEGEEIIRALARAHLEPNWKQTVPGLEIPARGLWRTSGTAERPDIEQFPSPYQLGIAPTLKTGYVETFRGCPIHCAFCQWGEQKSDRVHSADYLARHLEGLRASDARNVFFLDAAFNLSPRAFRSLVEAERRVGALRDKVVHGHLYPTHLSEEHLTFFSELHQVQASVGIQSFDEKVLARLGRPFDVERFESVVRMMRGRLDVDIELIFGLPGDNPASFRRTLERSLELGSSVKVFRCLVLPDALIERSASLSIEFNPSTFQLISCEGWSAADLEREWRWVYDLASQARDPILNDEWVGFVIAPPLNEQQGGNRHQGEVAKAPPIAEGIVRELAARIAAAAAGWKLDGVREESDTLLFDLQSPRGDIVLEVIRHRAGNNCFAARDGLAYSHRGHVDRQGSTGLRAVIDAVHGEALNVVRTGA